MNHNFVLSNCDTDSISFRKSDGSYISPEEREKLLNELNSLFPEKIKFADDGYFPKFIVLAAKNYIMKDEKGKVKLKGSSLKSSTLPPAFKLFLNEIIASILEDKKDYVDKYTKYVLQIMNIVDIKPYCSKKTLSKTTYESTRENEAKIIRAIKDTDYREGDKVYTFFDKNDELVLAENFKGLYNEQKLLKALYNCTDRFSTVLDSSMFLNYSLVKNQNLLRELQGLPPIVKESKKKKKLVDNE